ncbi:hypothetical protein QR680_001719 [Steinernema hermaphroditum]|uniref:Ig-like domain-containing protein n=1 Tax=Steinernema hermaphroditum TaxID=289476 RepID=A0AA39H2E5_9BILA|nr:hypothetical protein QR680_001719 [Steinernema hermaphroditum]
MGPGIFFWRLQCLLLSLILCSTTAHQRIVRGPEDTVGSLHSTVILRCQVEDQKGAVQWVKNDFGLGTDRALPDYRRYSMVGRVNEGEYHLKIENVTLEDDDIYECQLEQVLDNAGQRSTPARLSVHVEPQAPRMISAQHVSAVAGMELRHSCTSVGGRPAPKLGWVISDSPQFSNNVTWLGDSRTRLSFSQDSRKTSGASLQARIINANQENSRLFSVFSNVSFIPKADYDGKYLMCIARHETYGKEVRSAAVRMDLKFAPRVSLSVVNGEMKEGEDVVLLCNVDAKPISTLRISWFHKGNHIRDKTTDSLVMRDLRMIDHGSEVVCSASNQIGTTTASMILNITYGPRFVNEPQNIEALPGESVHMSCHATGNPTPEIVWYKVGQNSPLSKGENFTIVSVHKYQAGEYYCLASVPGFQQVNQSNYLFIRGPPSVRLPPVLYANKKEDFQFHCDISGRPLAHEVVWWHNGKVLDTASLEGRVEIKQIPTPTGMQSQLSFHNIEDMDFGVYNCSAANPFGSKSESVELREQSVGRTISRMISETGNYVMVAGILFILAVASLICLGCLCCMCRKRCMRRTKKISGDHADVTIKCEALDGGQFYPEMYSGSPSNPDDVTIYSKDYIAIPQNNPDLDYLPPPTFQSVNGSPYQYYNPSTGFESTVRIEPSHDSFASNLSTSGTIISDAYGNMYSSDKLAPLEPLTEVATPDTESGTPLLGPLHHDRPTSRTSTHV